jgi:integrase
MSGSRAQTRRRQKGRIEVLPSGALRVVVYAGVDPISKRRHYLTETIPAPGPSRAEQREAEKLADKVLRRLLSEVDEKRNPRTKATVNQLIARWLKVARIEPSTRRGYLTKINKHIKPLLGSLSVGRLDAEVIDSFYAELARCRDHCDKRPYVERHWTTKERDCKANSADPKQACRWHECKGLSDSSIRQIHWILSGALDRAVRWKWIGVNPVAHADPPSLPHPNPHPPTPEQAAMIVNHAFETDPDWGTFVWLAMTTGARRGELCPLRWDQLDMPPAGNSGTMTINTALALNDERRWYEETKTHQQRRVALDEETVVVLREHKERALERCHALGVDLINESFVFLQ